MKIREKEIDDRIKTLRTTVKASGLVADKDVAGELVDKDGDDKRWKYAIKEAKEEQIKKKRVN